MTILSSYDMIVGHGLPLYKLDPLVQIIVVFAIESKGLDK
jgi:hypothetical protein